MLPFIEIFGIRLPMYGLCLASGILLAGAIACLRAKKRGLMPDSVLIIGAAALLGALVGAKLLYIVATYGAGRFVSDMMNGDFSALSGGGLVFYGGLIGGVAGAFLGGIIAKERISDFADIMIPVIPLAHALGRTGCFLAGCCYGMAYNGFCSVTFPGMDHAVLPVQLIEAALNLALAIGLMAFTWRRRRGLDTLFVYLASYAAMRFCLEFARGDAARGALLGVSTSQWICVAMLTVSALYALLIRRRLCEKL